MNKREVPQLNEVVYGVILKWVVRKEQERLLETEMTFSRWDDINLTVKWPTQLRSNSERLVHHTSVKLLSNCRLNFNFWKFGFRYKGKKSRYEVFQEDWKTMKHFGMTFTPFLKQTHEVHPPMQPPCVAEQEWPVADRVFYSPVELLYDELFYFKKKNNEGHEESCQCQWCILVKNGKARMWEEELYILQDTVPLRTVSNPTN